MRIEKTGEGRDSYCLVCVDGRVDSRRPPHDRVLACVAQQNAADRARAGRVARRARAPAAHVLLVCLWRTPDFRIPMASPHAAASPRSAPEVASRLVASSATEEDHRATCHTEHGYRRFFNQKQRARNLPPLLWTFPGAGNTWIRMLLDYSTGIYSGSIYGDPSLLPLLPGEGRCDRSVVAVKAHPAHLDSFDFVPTPAGTLRLNLTRKPQYAKCSSYRFDGAIVVTRDPFRAIWAEYKRYVNWREVVAGRPSGEGMSQGCRLALRAQSLHSGALLRACFDHGHFAHHAAHLARQWKHAWFHYGRFKSQFRANRLLTVSFEDLVDKARRAAVLRQMVDFVGPQPKARDRALECAFRLADSPHIHRDKRTERHGEVTSIEAAFANRTLVCLMWSFLRRKATKLGYAPFGKVQCDDFKS